MSTISNRITAVLGTLMVIAIVSALVVGAVECGTYHAVCKIECFKSCEGKLDCIRQCRDVCSW